MTSPHPTTELLIARHGEAHCNTASIIGGPTGCRGLTQRGRHQAQLLAEHLRQHQSHHPIHAIYTTPLRRTRETAAIIATALDIELEIVTELAEQHHGTADGRPWRDVVTEFGKIPAHHPNQPLAPDGETWTEYLHRSRNALTQILARHTGKRILIVGHGDTVDAAFHHFFDLPTTSRATATIAMYHASLTVWRQQPTSWINPTAGLRWALLTHNDTRHLTDTPKPHPATATPQPKPSCAET
ncbi:MULTISPECIES: histidine phosphatase family protein [Nocardia]|uniref:histidine phosphatase family protein n=1 Tax=Nocardia TaxID=1817 RepID=UPI00031A913F|nr:MULTISPECIES: histidine phosphatase family protein [Nocardia]